MRGMWYGLTCGTILPPLINDVHMVCVTSLLMQPFDVRRFMSISTGMEAHVQLGGSNSVFDFPYSERVLMEFGVVAGGICMTYHILCKIMHSLLDGFTGTSTN